MNFYTTPSISFLTHLHTVWFPDCCKRHRRRSGGPARLWSSGPTALALPDPGATSLALPGSGATPLALPAPAGPSWLRPYSPGAGPLAFPMPSPAPVAEPLWPYAAVPVENSPAPVVLPQAALTSFAPNQVNTGVGAVGFKVIVRKLCGNEI